MSRLLCGASAGTGKTYLISEEVAKAVRAGTDPRRILGATFTIVAAAELKSRVQERLLRDKELDPAKRVEQAERLELATLGTVHSIGHQLLRRYALQLGLSPRLAVAEEDAAQALVEEALGRMPPEPWQALAAAGQRLGIHQHERIAQALLALQRTNRIREAQLAINLQDGADRVCELLGQPDAQAGSLSDLDALAARTLDRLLRARDGQQNTQDATEKLNRIVGSGCRTWRDAATLAGLKAGKTSGADAVLEDLRAAALQSRRMPLLHQDIRTYAKLLAEQTVALGKAYEALKQERGLLDFADLEGKLLDLLEDPAIGADIRATYDLIVVDEFQDTNPIQLAIFARLHDLVGRSIWVGDEKQAIYGFRDADSQLMADVWAGGQVHGARDGAPDLLAAELLRHGDQSMQLSVNRRSQAGLVDVFNAFFVPVFGSAAHMEPDSRHPAMPAGLERWRLLGTRNHEDFSAVASGVQELAREGVPLRHVAVLCRTNRHARAVGEALRTAGIPVATPLPGLLRTRECAVALAGLRVALDRWDALACAEVLQLVREQGDATPAWFEARLREVAAGHDGEPFAGDPLLTALEGLLGQTLPPAESLSAVLHALDLPGRIAAWGSPAQRAAHLDALLALARGFEDRCLAEGRAATLEGLVVELEARRRDERDPFPTPRGLDAVTVLTYHGSKGREWEVVILTGLDTDIRPDPWRPQAAGGRPDLGKPLDGRTLRAWIWPFGTGGPYQQRSAGCGLKDDTANSPEGQAVANAEQQEARRLLYVGMTRAKHKLVLAHRWDPGKAAGKHRWLAEFPVDTLLPPDSPVGEHALPGCSTTGRIRDLRPAPPAPPPAQSTWVAEPPIQVLAVRPRYQIPSGAEPVPALVGSREVLGPRFAVPRLTDEQQEAVGKAVHAYLSGLPSLAHRDAEAKQRVAQRCLAGFRVEGFLAAPDLVDAGERLQRWVAAKFPGATWQTEVAVTAPAADGSQWNGFIDLLLHLPDGSVVVVDHKAAALPEAMWDAKAAEHAGQLQAYGTILEAQGLHVAGSWVHFPLGGGLVPLSASQAESRGE